VAFFRAWGCFVPPAGLVDREAAAHGLGVPVETIRTWHKRGRVHVKGYDNRGRALYAYAELVDLERELRLRRTA